MTNLSPASASLFRALAFDADNWSGVPCWGGNVGGSKEDRGNLTDLKRKGLLYTQHDEGCEWVYFTPEGKALAATFGVTL